MKNGRIEKIFIVAYSNGRISEASNEFSMIYGTVSQGIGAVALFATRSNNHWVQSVGQKTSSHALSSKCTAQETENSEGFGFGAREDWRQLSHAIEMTWAVVIGILVRS